MDMTHHTWWTNKERTKSNELGNIELWFGMKSNENDDERVLFVIICLIIMKKWANWKLKWHHHLFMMKELEIVLINWLNLGISLEKVNFEAKEIHAI